MIFVTVGTHEQSFERLVKCVDELKGEGIFEDEVVIQTGYSLYEPRNCEWSRWFPFSEMGKYVDSARIVITHGGPSSFIMPLRVGKIPIVVPRQKQFGEHVNDHQLVFCREAAERMNSIIVVENVDDLGSVIINYENIASSVSENEGSNNKNFCAGFERMIEGIFEEEIL